MKKKVLVFALVLLCSLSLWAGIDTILSVKTYFTGNNIPESGLYYNDAEGKKFYDWNNVEDPAFWNRRSESNNCLHKRKCRPVVSSFLARNKRVWRSGLDRALHIQ